MKFLLVFLGCVLIGAGCMSSIQPKQRACADRVLVYDDRGLPLRKADNGSCFIRFNESDAVVVFAEDADGSVSFYIDRDADVSFNPGVDENVLLAEWGDGGIPTSELPHFVYEDVNENGSFDVGEPIGLSQTQ